MGGDDSSKLMGGSGSGSGCNLMGEIGKEMGNRVSFWGSEFTVTLTGFLPHFFLCGMCFC